MTIPSVPGRLDVTRRPAAGEGEEGARGMPMAA